MVKKIFLPMLVVMLFIITSFLLFSDLELYFTNLLTSVKTQPFLYAAISALILLSDSFLPVPSSIIMYTNGYVLGILPGALISLITLMLSAILGYYMGIFSSVGLKAKSDLQANSLLTKYGAFSIFITRGIPILSESICFLYGYNQMPLRAYLFYNLLGYIPLSLLYAICGNMGYNQNIFLLSFGLSLLFSGLLWVLFRKKIMGFEVISMK